MSFAVGSSAATPRKYSVRVIRCWSYMSFSTRLRLSLAAPGWAIGSNADGDATIPARSAASGGVSSEAHFGRFPSPQPEPAVVDDVDGSAVVVEADVAAV